MPVVVPRRRLVRTVTVLIAVASLAACTRGGEGAGGATSSSAADPGPAPSPVTATRAASQDLSPGERRLWGVFETMRAATRSAVNDRGTAHVDVRFAETGTTLQGDVRTGPLQGDLPLGWWFTGVLGTPNGKADVVAYLALYDPGVMWTRDGTPAGGRSWIRVADGPSLAEATSGTAGRRRLDALAADHPGVAVSPETIRTLVPWFAATPIHPRYGTVSGPFPDDRGAGPLRRYDLDGEYGGRAGTCRLWVSADGLPVEREGCFAGPVRSAAWSGFGRDLPAPPVPPLSDTVDVLDLLR